MKKITSLLILLFLWTSNANAAIVTVTLAQKVAENFYKLNSKQILTTTTLKYIETSSDGNAVYYVFNMNENDGFVILAADNNAHPIIGYSTNGQFIIPTPTSNIAYWLNKRKNEIIYMRENHNWGDAEITSEWSKYSADTKPQNNRSAMSAVAPLMHTTWDQSPYYNALCPSNSVTGCLATAMAQIMKYWNYPATGNGSSSYCDCTSAGFASNYGTLSANYGTTTYNWSNMPLNVTSANNDVATLMYNCGVSIEMDYSPTVSYAFLTGPINTACSQSAYLNYFKYDPTTLQDFYKSNFTDAAWIALLKNDLNIGRPIQFLGQDATQGGHSWVCDGYDANDNFHMNWGWGGSDDGYFPITNFNNAGYNPVLDQAVLIGIQPLSTTNVTEAINSSEEFSIYPNPANTSFTISGNSLNGKIHFALNDVTGREVKTGDINSNAGTFNETIAISGLSNGMYFIKVNDDKNSRTKKLQIK